MLAFLFNLRGSAVLHPDAVARATRPATSSAGPG